LESGGIVQDSQIIELMQSNPSEGLYEAINKYNGLLVAVVSRILRGMQQDVEECVSDAFLNVWKSRDRLDPETSTLKGFLLCTARNVAINRYKQLKRHDTAPLDETQELVSADDVELEVMQAEDVQVLMQLINELHEPDREIMLRKHFLFEPVKDIAERLAMDPIQVKNRLYQAKKRLKTTLVERGVSDYAN